MSSIDILLPQKPIKHNFPASADIVNAVLFCTFELLSNQKGVTH